MFKFKFAVFALLALLAPGLAFAVDPTPTEQAVSAIGAASAPIALIGAAVLLVLVGIKVIKWVRRAL